VLAAVQTESAHDPSGTGTSAGLTRPRRADAVNSAVWASTRSWRIGSRTRSNVVGRAKTYAPYAQMVRGHMLREFGSVKLRELSARRVQAWLDAKEDAGLSARTVRYLRDILRSALSHAWRNELVADNVA